MSKKAKKTEAPKTSVMAVLKKILAVLVALLAVYVAISLRWTSERLVDEYDFPIVPHKHHLEQGCCFCRGWSLPGGL
jgi:hypothetical protein